ncbi:MAG: hypothetical protein WCV82_00300 [Candidatus Paceibacterota bacterium]
MPSESIQEPIPQPENWIVEASQRETDLKIDKLTSSDSELVGAAYERAGNYKKAAEFYLMYGGGESAIRIFDEQAFSPVDITEVKRNAADRLDSFAQGIEEAPRPTPPLNYPLPDYSSLAKDYRKFAGELRNQVV